MGDGMAQAKLKRIEEITRDTRDSARSAANEAYLTKYDLPLEMIITQLDQLLEEIKEDNL